MKTVAFIYLAWGLVIGYLIGVPMVWVAVCGGLISTFILTTPVVLINSQRQQTSTLRIFNLTFGRRKTAEAKFVFGIVRVTPWRVVSSEAVFAPELSVLQVGRMVAALKGFIK